MAMGFWNGRVVVLGFFKLMESKTVGKGEDTGTIVYSHDLHISTMILNNCNEVIVGFPRC